MTKTASTNQYIIFHKDRIALYRTDDDTVRFPENLSGIPLLNASDFIEVEKTEDTCFHAAVIHDHEDFNENFRFTKIRSLYSRAGEPLFSIIMHAHHLAAWDSNSRHCGQCGGKTDLLENERARQCTTCGNIIYPSPSPAIITSVTRGDRILLARHSRFSEMFTVLAGYVSPGETLEECVRREVKEEVNINIKNIRYFGSQPWGISQSLMIGFTAEYDSGEISPDMEEIIDADWFSAHNMPPYPGPPSIAHSLIENFIRNHNYDK